MIQRALRLSDSLVEFIDNEVSSAAASSRTDFITSAVEAEYAEELRFVMYRY